MEDSIVDPTFNLQRTLDGEKVTDVVVETALPLTLTQDSRKSETSGYLKVASTANLRVFGDEVTVSGKLSFPGRNVEIFARVLRAEPDGKIPPTISVDGPDLPEELAKPRALDQGESPDKIKQKRIKGEDGAGGYNHRVPPFPLDSDQEAPGEAGWSGPDHPELMNGEPGNKGKDGSAAGSVWICSYECDFGRDDAKLTITAAGGTGGEGQPGQEGARGGNGGNGFDIKVAFMGPITPTAGGDGGQGGMGGKGGQGGQGGKGGTIKIHCISAQPAVVLNCAGGQGGSPGQPGRGGEGGAKGVGGKGGSIHDPMGGVTEIAKAADGHDGPRGGVNGPGDKAPASLAGTSSTDTGSIETSGLTRFLSVSQLQMMFEHARADYLLTEPADYSIRLMVAASDKDLQPTGKNLVVVAFVGKDLRIRIFDANKVMVVDKTEADLVSTDSLARLRKRFDLTMGQFILAGDWPTEKAWAAPADEDRHAALVKQLTELSNGLADEESKIDQLSDYELTGALALAVFLRETGIRDGKELKKSSVDDQRKVLIRAMGERFGYPEDQLSPMDYRKLVLLAKLGELTNNKADDKRAACELSDYELVGALALALFLRKTGIRDEKGLKTYSVDDQRNILIIEMRLRYGYTDQQEWPTDLQKLVLLAKLGELTNNKADSKRAVRELSDYELIGALALALFLRETGIRDEKALKTYSVDNQRNTLIMELGLRYGYTSAQMWPMDTQKLLLLALRPGGDWVIGESLSGLIGHLSVREEEQEQLVHEAGLCTRYRDPWTTIGERLVWVNQLLKATSQTPVPATEENPQKALAKTLYASAFTVFKKFTNGLDYFGKTPGYTPMLSLDSYNKSLESSLSILKTVEDQRDKYFTCLHKQQDATSDLQLAIGKTDAQKAFLTGRKADLKADLNKVTVKIEELEGAQKTAHPALAAAMKRLDAKVKSSFGLSWQTFFNCLSMLSFTSVNEPRTATKTLVKAGGYASAGAMVGSQVGAMISEGVNNVLTDSGEPVNRDWILEQIEVVQGDINLHSEFEKREGFFTPGGSKRLLVELDQFRGLCKKFYRFPEAQVLRKELDSFIETITARNLNIDYLNYLLLQLCDLSAEIKRLEQQKAVVEGQLTNKAKPGLPAMAGFVSGLYERAKVSCISDLYNAYRAYAFWALEPYSGFYDLLGHSPSAITYLQLLAASGDLTAKLFRSLEKARRTPNVFPSREEDENSIGEVVVLTKSSHLKFFSDLISSGSADFELEPATNSSTQPFPTFSPTAAAWCGPTRPNFAAEAPNPFHGKLDVRLTKVRTWMVGMKTDGNHEVTLTHLGKEQFRHYNDLPYPSRKDPPWENDLNKRNPEYVTHDQVPIPFSYNSANLSYDPEKCVFTPGQLFGKGVSGSMDGNLGFPTVGEAALPEHSTYAPIGPFGKWRVEVNVKNNHGLDLRNLTAVVIDLHGFNDVYRAMPGN